VLEEGGTDPAGGSPVLDELVASAELVVLSADGDPDAVLAQAGRLRALRPGLVVTVVSPFGLTGPYRTHRSSALVDWAMGGHLLLNGERDREPIAGAGPWSSYLGGATAALASQAAVFAARRRGLGDLVDVGNMEAAVACHQWTITIATHQGVRKTRWGNRHGEAHHPLCLYQCSDGWVVVGAVTRPQWEGLCIAADAVELLADDALFVPAERFDRMAEVDEAVAPWFLGRTRAEAVQVLQEHRCPAGSVLALDEVLRSPQLEARRFWAVPDGMGPAARIPGPPFRLAAVTSSRPSPPSQRPPIDLAGVRVLEFSVAWAGPMAGRWLGEFGADVIKIEHPTSRGLAVGSGMVRDPGWRRGELPGPALRNGIFPDNDPGEQWWNRLGYFNKINRTKRSLCLDVKAPGGREIFEELVRRSDIVLNNYSPRGVKSLGIDHETLRALNPRIITVDLSGFGATGPEFDQVSWGPILEAASGLAHATGYIGSGPYKQGLAFPDAVGGLHGTIALLAALWERERTGEAVHVDVSQLETYLQFGGELCLATSLAGNAPERHGNRAADAAPQGVYPCRGEDRWIALTVTDDACWSRLVGVAGAPLDRAGWATSSSRRADHDEIDALLAGWTSCHDARDLMDVLQAQDIPAGMVMANEDLLADPQLAAREFFVTVDQVGAGPLTFPGFPVHSERTPCRVAPTPALGQHNGEILRWLGYDDAAIAGLAAAATIADSPPD
jgi:crotonobetainyl-CoA:carnitine CoA-transferase CaiB-like acyl-CoA transferase